jgi:hypothetical protein
MTAWTAPRTWTASELVTASIGNTHWRDNLLYLKEQRDLIRADVDDHAAGLATRSCRVRHATNQSIANNSSTTLAFDTDVHDTDTMHDPATNNERITIRKAGYYLVGANVEWAANATGTRALQIYGGAGAADLLNRVWSPAAGASWPLIQQVSGVWYFNALDILVCSVYQDSGGALNVVATSPSSPSFWAHRLASPA